jgi:sigma-B regulation protein RsbU (phosphoserine phosphatase)
LSDEEFKITAPVLEAPPSAEDPAMGAGLFGDESLAQSTAKCALSEGFLRALTRDLKFQDFMREILLIMMKVVKSEAGSILEVDHVNNTLFFRSTVGVVSDQLGNFTVPLGQGIAGYVAESRQSLNISNVRDHEGHLKSIERAVKFETRNMVALPIVMRGKTYGVMELINRVGDQEFTQTDMELLTYACEMAAKAIEVRLMLGWSAQASRKTQQGEAA